MAKYNANAKAAAQASVANVSESVNPTGAEKSKIELFGEAFVSYVKRNFDKCVEKKSNSEILLHGVNTGKGAMEYRMSIVKTEAKEGRRPCYKRELYRVGADGTERIVQFGNFKKKYLYPLMGMVLSGKPTKVEKMKVDPAMTKKIAEAIKADRKAYSFKNGILTGKVADIGAIKMIETTKTLKTGKTQLVRQLFVNDKLALEGGQLGRIKNAFVKTGSHRSMKDIIAEANETASDLI